MIGFKKQIALLFLMSLFTAPLSSQTAERLEALLETPELSWSEAAAFILEASDMGSYGMAPFHYAMEQKWLPKNASPDDAARLNGIALLLMQSFELKGGIFYRISKSPHHAYRELVYKKIIRSNTDPDMPVSGPQLLLIVSRILSAKEQL